MIVTIAIIALIAGFALALAAFGTCLLMGALELLRVSKEQMLTAVSERVRAERETASAKAEQAVIARAIESNSLPWFPKTDKLEARYENEAIDKMENPSFYADVVEGLGGTR